MLLYRKGHCYILLYQKGHYHLKEGCLKNNIAKEETK
jgi:hypothetical protein